MASSRSSKRITATLLLSFCFLGSPHADQGYPQTRVVEASTGLHDTVVPDPYRWLEALQSDEVQHWIKEQDHITTQFVEATGLVPRVQAALDRISKTPVFALPWVRAGRELWLETRPGLEQPILRIRDTATQQVRTLVDPNTLASDGSLSISLFRPSPNGELVVYKLRKKGTQNFLMHVASTKDGHRVSEVVEPSSVAGAENVVWSPDSLGFYYTRSVAAVQGTGSRPGQSGHEAIYYHLVSEADSSKDQRIFGDAEHPTWRFGPGYAGDQYFVAYLWEKSAQTRGMALLPSPGAVADGQFPVFIDPTFQARSRPLGFSHGKLLAVTNDSAPNQKVVEIDPKHPQRDAWKVVVPEKETPIDDVVLVNDKVVVTSFVDVSSAMSVYTASGKHLGDVELPGPGVVTNTLANNDEDSFLFAYESLITPRTIYSLSPSALTYSVRTPAQVPFDSNRFIVKREFVTTRDGTRVPVFIARAKGSAMDGTSPMLLTGYGGFNYAFRPRFGIEEATWLELGGSLAIANIRGGGEYGETWHKGGMLLNKKNAFNDFVDTAQWLIERKYTSAGRIAIMGNSNGGLLVSAAVNQNPKLFGAVVNGFGLTDMVRNETAKTRFDWTDELGSVADAKTFNYLLSYSPLHNIKANVNYPPVLVLAGELDDRVVPWHQYKYVAALQNSSTGPSKKLLAVSWGSGHAFGKSASTLNRERLTILTFMASSLALRPD